MDKNENSEGLAAKRDIEYQAVRTGQSEYVAETRQIWQTTLRDLQAKMSRTDYDSWIKNLSLLELRQGTALMSAPSSFAKRRLESDYAGIIQQALTRVVGEHLEIQFSVDQPMQPQLFDDIASVPLSLPKARPALNGPIKQSNPGNNRPGYLQNGNGRGNGQSGKDIPANLAAGLYTPFVQPSGSESNGERYDPKLSQAESVAENQPEHLSRPNNSDNSEFKPGGYGYDPASRNGSGLNPRYIFDKYVVGSSNRVATAAAHRVAEMPGFSYNPLFIYGSVGLGKTHLLQAIGHDALKHQPDLTVLYVSSEKFTNDLVNSIKEGRMEGFRSRYRTIDILMIDDIQFIAGKEATQEEFFHTFNSLVEANKQVVISSDRPPRAMLVLEERLRSRFEGGLTCDVQSPDYEMKLAILSAKADAQDVNIPADVLEFIARKRLDNIRELEGALTRVVAFALHNRTPISVDQASQALNDLMLNNRKKVTPARIVDQVSDFFSIDQKELRGRSRSQDIVMPRQIAMYIIREHTETSLVEIGQELGGRDHTTVMHAIDKIEREIESNPNLRSQINTIVQIIYSESGGK